MGLEIESRTGYKVVALKNKTFINLAPFKPFPSYISCALCRYICMYGSIEIQNERFFALVHFIIK
jgi:hypothetical protein